MTRYPPEMQDPEQGSWMEEVPNCVDKALADQDLYTYAIQIANTLKGTEGEPVMLTLEEVAEWVLRNGEKGKAWVNAIKSW